MAALLGSVVHGRAPIVEGELPINGYRFGMKCPLAGSFGLLDEGEAGD